MYLDDTAAGIVGVEPAACLERSTVIIHLISVVYRTPREVLSLFVPITCGQTVPPVTPKGYHLLRGGSIQVEGFSLNTYRY